MGRRGRGVLVQLSKDGKIGAMEIAGTSLQLTLDAWERLQESTYGLADVVVITPETAGVLKTGEAIRLLWRQPEVRVGWLWPQREATMRRHLECFYDMAKTLGVSSIEMPRKNTIVLPSREVPPPRPKAPAPISPLIPPPAPPPIDEKPAKPTLVEHKVGRFGFIEIVRGPYFEKTPSERNADVTAIQTAAGGGAVMSEETAIEQVARTFNIDPHDEMMRSIGLYGSEVIPRVHALLAATPNTEQVAAMHA